MKPKTLRQLGAGFGLVVAIGSAWSQDIGAIYEGGKVYVNLNELNRTYTTTAGSGGAVNAAKAFRLPAPGGTTVAANAIAVVGKSSTLLFAARALSLGSGVGAALAIGSAAYDIYDTNRVRSAGQGGGLMRDPGTPQVPQPNYTGSISCGAGADCNGVGATPQAACAAIASKMNNYNLAYADPHTWYVDRVELIGVNNYQCRYKNSNNNIESSTLAYGVVLSCPASVNFENPALSIPSGRPIGPDGKCATGAYTQGVTPEEAAQFANASQYAQTVDYKKILDDALMHYAPPKAIVETLPVDIQAVTPSRVAGPVSTTIEGDVKTETATGWDWRKDLDKPQGTWDETKTVTKTSVATGAPVAPPSTTTTTPAPSASDPCTLNPDRAGCTALGTAPASVPLPTSAVPATWRTVVFGTAATCPPGISFEAYGARSISFGPMCDLMTTLRPLFLGLGVLAAAFIFVQGFKL